MCQWYVFSINDMPAKSLRGPFSGDPVEYLADSDDKQPALIYAR